MAKRCISRSKIKKIQFFVIAVFILIINIMFYFRLNDSSTMLPMKINIPVGGLSDIRYYTLNKKGVLKSSYDDLKSSYEEKQLSEYQMEKIKLLQNELNKKSSLLINFDIFPTAWDASQAQILFRGRSYIFYYPALEPEKNDTVWIKLVELIEEYAEYKPD